MVSRWKVWTEERIGGQLSADKINSDVTLYSCEDHNFYTVVSRGKTYIIGGVPEKYSDEYADAAKTADAIILLTSMPEFSLSVAEAVKVNPEIKIIASPAGLRDIKEIINCEVNEETAKNGTNIDGIEIIVTPGIPWVDSVMAVYNGILFSGAAFSGFDGSAVGLKSYYDDNLAVSREFIYSALDDINRFSINMICPSYGLICPQGSECISALPEEVFGKYRQWSEEIKKPGRIAAVVYSSRFGFTRELAQYATTVLEEDFNVILVNAEEDPAKAALAINSSDVFMIGTNTINRNAPECIWKIISLIDAVNKRGTKYAVFGSYGWAADGIKLVDKVLETMGMRKSVRPVEVLFRPGDDDFEKIRKAAKMLAAE